MLPQLLIGVLLLGVATGLETPDNIEVVEVVYNDGNRSVVEDIAIERDGNFEFHHLTMKPDGRRKRRNAEPGTDSADADEDEEKEEEFIFRDYDRGLEVVVPFNSTLCLVQRLGNNEQMINRTIFNQSTKNDEGGPEAVQGVLEKKVERQNFTYSEKEETLDRSELPDQIQNLCAERELRFVEPALEANEDSESVSKRSTRMKRWWPWHCYWFRYRHQVCLPYYYTETYCCQYRTTGWWWRRRRYCSRWCSRRVRLCYVTWLWFYTCTYWG